ncbi:MAG: glutaredoxin domain-containing protein, partial [Promethearchaeota archaeon]
MTEQQIPIIITKKDCYRCADLKEWMKENNINYVEKDIDDETFINQLLNDQNFLKTFCDAEGCVVNTPAVLYKGKYWFKELWGISGLRKKEAEKLFIN